MGHHVCTNDLSIHCTAEQKKSHSEGSYYPYRVSKAGMHMLTKNFALDLAKDGINVIGVHPGWLKTRMGGKVRAMLELLLQH